ncbi:MAG: DUF521 domain-containing protein [Desulfobacterales bacterium]|nr:DUF521 domain-containing protein [Desulfobacterales bacterium]
MKLTSEERSILEGREGKTLKKVMKSLVMFGDAFDAERLASLDGPVPMVFSTANILMAPYLDMVNEIVNQGLIMKKKFTVDPRPFDFENIEYTEDQKAVLNNMFPKEKEYKEQLLKAGLKDENAYTCTCYMKEVGNTPKKGDILAWAESSAVVFANSVLGARTNRNAGGMEFLSGILGKTPLFGLLTDEGRKARWRIELKTSRLPEATVLGSAIGMKVNEDVPYIVGLDKFIGKELNSNARDYCKDMGAAAASNGAVGLYHVENLTPEAVEKGEELFLEDHRNYIVDDKEIERIIDSYPLIWENPKADPDICFIGCPHLSLDQLYGWSKKINSALKTEKQKRVRIQTYLAAAPDVIEKFKQDKKTYQNLLDIGVKPTSLCPLIFLQIPASNIHAAITNSNKLRTYSTARYLTDEKTVQVIVKGII